MSKPATNPYQASRIYWEQLDIQSRSYKQVAIRLGIKGAASNKAAWDHIGRLVRQWEIDGHVMHVVQRAADRLEYAPLLPDLEDELRRRFGLRDVIVVDTSTLHRPDGTPDSNEDDWNSYDDRIHQLLGRWAGRVLSTLLRNEDVVGTGGGRGPHYAAEACLVPDASTCFPKRIVSLTGSMSTRVWGSSKQTARELDADNVAMLLKGGLQATELPTLLNCPITDRSRSPDISGVKIVLAGIGALGGGHRLRLIHHRSPELKAVESVVEKLNDLAQKVDPRRERQPFPHWIGDVCNYYFVVNDNCTGLAELDKGKRRQIENLIKELNRKLVNTDPDSLSAICRSGAVIAVAGGPHKVSIMSHVLQKFPPWISHLVTDSDTVNELLASH